MKSYKIHEWSTKNEIEWRSVMLAIFRYGKISEEVVKEPKASSSVGLCVYFGKDKISAS